MTLDQLGGEAQVAAELVRSDQPLAPKAPPIVPFSRGTALPLSG